MATDVMIDIESLDTSPDCVILTIGAVLFDPCGHGIIDKIEIRPTIEDQTEIYNRSINDATMEWWGKQSPEAIEEAMGDRDRVSFEEAMNQLYKFCWNRAKVHGVTVQVLTLWLWIMHGDNLVATRHGTSGISEIHEHCMTLLVSN